MNRFLNEISQPYFWIMLVVVTLLGGALASVFGSYIRDVLDAVLRRVTRRYRDWISRENARIEAISRTYERLNLEGMRLLVKFWIVMLVGACSGAALYNLTAASPWITAPLALIVLVTLKHLIQVFLDAVRWNIARRRYRSRRLRLLQRRELLRYVQECRN